MPQADVELRINMSEYTAQVDYVVLVYPVRGPNIPTRYYPSNAGEQAAKDLADTLRKGYPNSSIAIATITETRKWHIKKSAELWPE
jgi:hypothetical protein